MPLWLQTLHGLVFGCRSWHLSPPQFIRFSVPPLDRVRGPNSVRSVRTSKSIRTSKITATSAPRCHYPKHCDSQLRSERRLGVRPVRRRPSPRRPSPEARRSAKAVAAGCWRRGGGPGPEPGRAAPELEARGGPAPWRPGSASSPCPST